MSFESEELSRPETVVEESSTARTTPSSDRKTSMELSITAASTSSAGGLDRTAELETQPMAIVKKDSAHSRSLSQQESPDDGLGGSFARGESVAIESERSVDILRKINSVAPCMNLISHSNTRRHKIKLKLGERLFDSCFSTLCCIYSKF